MEDLSTFLELPLDRDMYSPNPKLKEKEPPLRILITEANSKIAQNLIYKICVGDVFGPDQEVILHLTFSKGKKDPKTIVGDLHLCGFPVFLDAVVDSDPKKIYKNVDLVVAITTFEEFFGHKQYSSYLHQLFLTVQAARNMLKYGKRNSKMVICSPSTKGSITVLTTLKQLNLNVQCENFSCVTILDETIAKSLIAAKLKTTTTQIKNVVIWGATHADIRNGTAFIYPPEDRGQYKKVDVPLVEALNDDNWINSDLLKSLRSRVIDSCLVSRGGAVAAATATHLKLLFQGSDIHAETLSMGVIVSSDRPYGLTPQIGFSLPVTTKRGRITVREDVTQDVYSYLLNMRDEYNLTRGKMEIISKAAKYFNEQSMKHKRDFDWLEALFPNDLESQKTTLKYILSYLPQFENPQKMGSQSVSWSIHQAQLNSAKTKAILKFTNE